MNFRRWSSMHGLARNIAGTLLMLAGIGLIGMTAQNLISYHVTAARHGGEMIDFGTGDAMPQAGQNGYMARIAGTPKVVEAPRDPDFNLQANTPTLIRHVDMFQWREIRIGDAVHYELDWADHLIDSSRFVQPAGHTNPSTLPISGKRFDAGLVQMGGFRLSAQLMHAIPGSVPIAPDPKALPANLAASFSRYQGYLVTGAHPGDPRLGDVRVSWDAVPLQPMTVFARIDGDRLVTAPDAADGKGYDVEVGAVSLLDMFPDIPVPPRFTLGRRILAVLLAASGAYLLFSVHRERRDVWLALAVGALAVGSVASVLWLGNDTRTLLGWLGVTILGLLVASWRLRRRRFGGPTT
ncbi:MAG: TMEM43 family protein [Rhodanobacter sp.]